MVAGAKCRSEICSLGRLDCLTVGKRLAIVHIGRISLDSFRRVNLVAALRVDDDAGNAGEVSSELFVVRNLYLG